MIVMSLAATSCRLPPIICAIVTLVAAFFVLRKINPRHVFLKSGLKVLILEALAKPLQEPVREAADPPDLPRTAGFRNGRDGGLAVHRGSARASLVALFWMGFYIALPTPSARSDFRWEVHRRWSLFRDPNVLNYRRKRWSYNPDIILPITPSGTILIADLPTDLHIELDREGRVSIHNARLSLRSLSAIIEGRLKRFNGTFRCFLWIDKRVEPQHKAQLLALLAHAGCTPLYCVGVRHGKKKPDFVITPANVGTNKYRGE